MSFNLGPQKQPSVTLAITSLLSGILCACAVLTLLTMGGGLRLFVVAFGLFSVFILPTCLTAVICGALARRYAWADPQNYGGYTSATTGFTLGSIVLVFWCAVVFFGIGSLTRLFKGPDTPVAQTSSAPAPDTISPEELAAREADARNGEMIVKNLTLRARTNFAGHFPPRMAFSILGTTFDPTQYVSQFSKTEPLEPKLYTDLASFMDLLDQHSDFVYIGADLDARALGSNEIVVLYTREVYKGHGRIVVYANGFASWVPEIRLERVFRLSNDIRMTMDLPRVAMDGPPPIWPVPARTQNPTVANRGNAGAGNAGQAVPPRPIDLHLHFESAADAFTYMQEGRPEEKRAALDYLATEVPEPALHDKVVPLARMAIADNTNRLDNIKVFANWATKDDVKSVRTLLEAMTPRTGFTGDVNEARPLVKALVRFDDKESAPMFARCLPTALREDVTPALISMGTSVEEPVLPYVEDASAEVARDAMKILGKVGTEKSIPALHRALGSKQQDVPKAAEDSLHQIATRLKLKPEQYLYALSDRYVLEAPAGFQPDASVSKPDTHQWVRAVPGRSVKSTYTVSVKYVGKDYPLNAPENAPIVIAGTLTFRQMEAQSNNIQKGVRYAAVDGEYLIELTAILDGFDNVAATSMSAAVAKIRVKEP